jgi:hypothetical protein
MTNPNPAEILRQLALSRVEFVVVGMVAGVLRGVPVTTRDLDIVHRRTAENVTRLHAVLISLGAVHRHDRRMLAPRESNLLGAGHQLLTTKYGDVDCLGEIDAGKVYEDLVEQSSELPLEAGLSVRVLDLGALIEIKQRAGRDKDLAVLPALRAALDESKRR